MTIYDAVTLALAERGWRLDSSAKETKCGELHEFVHPDTGAKLNWIEALYAEQDREVGAT